MRKPSFTILARMAIVALVSILPLAFSLQGKTKKAKEQLSGPAAEGEAIFKQNCNMCHFPDKTDVKLGPGLKGLFKNKELPASHKEATEENVRAQIKQGSPKAKPMPMPAFADKLSAEDLDKLIAYLKTL